MLKRHCEAHWSGCQYSSGGARKKCLHGSIHILKPIEQTSTFQVRLSATLSEVKSNRWNFAGLETGAHLRRPTKQRSAGIDNAALVSADVS